MTLEQLTRKYIFHDSLLEDVSYVNENSEIKMTIDFCYWMQNGYSDLNPETGTVTLLFQNVSNYSGTLGNYDDETILDVRLDDKNQICFSILSDETHQVTNIVISAEDVLLLEG